FLGGGLGSGFRYLLYRLFSNENFPIYWGTFTVNIIGSLILGVILGYSLKEGNFHQNTLLFLTTGFCGGFTTFSTFAYENQAFLKAGDYLNFTIYGLGSLITGIAAITLGFFVSRFF